ncbi:hypothetical protein HGM15179_003876 [Zosterops borbonicus]|uniref:Uncharacterized protein n=1 Tax=Zosterops borbonicus TaxID=364589 RepID=A0A8K1LQQ7_9PASS|nr:hypothetical protein HGM15179_003876 [Zosterops borbonicus]
MTDDPCPAISCLALQTLLAWVEVEVEEEEEEEEAGATSAQLPEELEELQLLQEDAEEDQAQEHRPVHGRFRRTVQMICEFIECLWEEETTGAGTGVLASFYLFRAETSAALLDLLVQKGVSNPKQVPAMVRYIHRWLTANESDEHRLDKPLVKLIKEYPDDVLLTLLRWAPSCDRAAAAMWRTIMTSSGIAEPALQILLDVMNAWPAYSVYTSDGDSTGVFALAATLTLWKIFNMTWCPFTVLEYFPHIFLRLLFQVYISTLDTPEEVNNFWEGCQEQHGLYINPNRFILQTLKTLLCRLQCEGVVLEMERKCGWDTLLCPGTHHYAVGLLAREMSHISIVWCYNIVCCLFDLLIKDISDWELPAMAFFVEILECLDFNEWGDTILETLAGHLPSKSKEMRRLALRGLLVLSKDHSMNERMSGLTESLGRLLWDADDDVVELSVVVLSFLLLHKDLTLSSPVALQLAEALWPLFNNFNSLVQLLSIHLFKEVMKLVAAKGKKPLKRQVSKSLLPLYFNCHDGNQQVAEASRKTLLSAVRFLKRGYLAHLVKTDQMWRFSEGLATLTLWKIFNMTWCPFTVLEYFPHIFLRLLFQVYISTLDTPEEVNNFWEGCQEQHGLYINPNRFILQTLKTLLCRLQCEGVVLEMERKCGWDTLLCPGTHHYAVGLLAREMSHISIVWCYNIVCCLFDLLIKDISDWELPAMAFFVEILECLDFNEWGDTILETLAGHLPSKSKEMRRLALRGLLVLSKDHSMSLGRLLWDADDDVVELSVVVLSFLLLHKDLTLSSPVALQLAEALWPLFNNFNSLVQLLSIHLFKEVMKLVAAKGKKPLKRQVSKSLLPLYFNCHDGNQQVAEASRKTLLSAVRFLKRGYLAHLVKTDQMWRFSEGLVRTVWKPQPQPGEAPPAPTLPCSPQLEEDTSRIREHLHLALPYLRSPQEPVREVAVRFIGEPGTRQHREFHIICKGPFKARLQHLLPRSFSKASLLQLGINPYIDMAEKSPCPPKNVEKSPSAAQPQQRNEMEQLQLLQEGPFKARLQHLLPRSFSKASLLQLGINPYIDMAEKSPCPPKNVEKSPSAAQPQQRNEMEQLQLLQEGKDQTQQQNPVQRCWRSIGQMFRNMKGTWCREMISMFTKGGAEPEPPQPQSLAPAPSLDFFGDRVVSSPSQVPGFVRNMHQRFLSDEPPDDRLFMDILRLTDAHPNDVAVTLLRCASSCDKGAAIMWKTIASSGETVDKVMPTLLCVMEDWPLHKMYTSDGDNKDVFALAILECLDFNEWGDTILEILTRYLPSESKERSRLALRGLLVLSKNDSMAKKMCSLSENLLELLKNEDIEVVRMTLSVFTNLLQNKDIFVSSPTAPKLAEALRPLFDSDNREVQLLSIRLYKEMMESVVENGKKPLKFFVNQSLLPLFFHCHDGNQKVAEILECLDFNEWGDTILEILTRYLPSESKERSRLALRGLLVLSKNDSMAKKMCSLSENLLELLKNEDIEVVRMTLSVFTNLLQNKDIFVSSPTAPKLAEALRPLFDSDNREVQLLSIRLYKEMMESVVENGKKPLKFFVNQSLLPLFFHCHDGNQKVAEAARETLLSAVSFLKRRDLKQLLKMDDPWSFGERVLAEDRSRAPENLRQALPYLESPQEPVREAAVRCIALQALSTDDSPSNTNLIVQVMLDERAAVLSSSGSKEGGQQHTPCKRRSPGDARKSAGAAGTADAGHT